MENVGKCLLWGRNSSGEAQWGPHKMNEDLYSLNSHFTSTGGICACFHTLPKVLLAAPGTGPEGEMGSRESDGIQKVRGSNGIWEGRGSEGIQKDQ